MKSLIFVLLLLASTISSAVTITSYDITGARRLFAPEGYCVGAWCWTYDGTITPSAAFSGADDYFGGSGTLNDGIVAGTDASQLLELYYNPVVTLWFDSEISVQTIEIYGLFGNSINYVPGALDGLTVTIGGVSQAFPTTGFGPPCIYHLYLCNDRVDLAGSSFASTLTDHITISAFTMDRSGYGGGGGFVNISEVVVFTAPVPEAATALQLIVGLGALGTAIRRRRLRVRNA